MSSAREQAAAFQTWHSPRTWEAGHPQMDPWLRGVLLALQVTLNGMAETIDLQDARIAQLEQQVRAR
jgi:hypothetical protein